MVTVSFPDLKSRAKSFGIISAAAGIGAAAGPLIGGLITSTISWRASFILQVLVVALIIFLSRRIADPGIQGAKPRFDLTGAILSAAGLFFVVLGILEWSFFVISVFLQTVRGYNAILTGLILTPATIGHPAHIADCEKFAKRYSRRTLIRSSFLTFIPGLLLMGVGVGVYADIPSTS